MKKETVGKASQRLIIKAYEADHTPHDQANEQLKDYEANVQLAAKEGKKKYTSDFYIVVLIKKERLMNNVIRLYYFSRQSCPTPQHEQVVYRYHRDSGEIEFLWVVPSLEACVTMVNEALHIHPDEKQLLQCVLDFRDGTLLRKAQELNNELNKRVTNEQRTNRTNAGIIGTS
jgi:hypothetical protein